MNPQLTQSLLTLLAIMSIASVGSSFIYLGFRFAEFKIRVLIQYIINFIFSAYLILIISDPIHFANDLKMFLASCCVGLVGASFHRNSFIEPKNFLPSFMLMSAVALSSLILNIMIVETDSSRNLTFKAMEKQFGFSVLLLVTAQSITAPFLIWVWKSSRLRPGVDKHLDS